jgi:hypothetical protein
MSSTGRDPAARESFVCSRLSRDLSSWSDIPAAAASLPTRAKKVIAVKGASHVVMTPQTDVVAGLIEEAASSSNK